MNITQFLNAALLREFQSDNTGQYAHLSVEDHLKRYPECRVINCEGHIHDRRGHIVLFAMVIIALLPILLLPSIMGTLFALIFAGGGLAFYVMESYKVRRTHDAQQESRGADIAELKRTRAFVHATIEQIKAHMAEQRTRIEKLIAQLQVEASPTHEGVRTLERFERIMNALLSYNTDQAEHHSTAGELWGLHSGTVKAYERCMRNINEAIDAMDLVNSEAKDRVRLATPALSELNRHNRALEQQLESAVVRPKPQVPQLHMSAAAVVADRQSRIAAAR